ncbi:hypothetical protein Q3G72_032498 [Acer saccharum]|nr:hypothetical protein Q3G72_032498 [Acer saccharum]
MNIFLIFSEKSTVKDSSRKSETVCGCGKCLAIEIAVRCSWSTDGSTGIKPTVTVLHYDSPQTLEEKYGGSLSHSFVDDFKDYVEILFRTFGDKVKNWITINEPLNFAKYDFGMPPQVRFSDRKTCKAR